MKQDYFYKLTVIIAVSIVNFITASPVFSERYITVATIGNSPAAIVTENNQEIVEHVISFWESEFKQVLRKKPDLIVLPELCDLSLLGKDYLEIRKNQVLDYFSSVARKNKCYIAFGMQREDEEGFWRNSCVLLDRNGGIAGIYDKNFPTVGEMQAGIKASDKATIIECDFGRVALAICFDLNFDELLKKYALQKPDLLIFSSMYHGGIAQSVWAYTCESYFVGSIYRGYPSEIRNPLGDIIASSTSITDYVVERINLDFQRVHLAYNILSLAALKKKYGKTVRITDPGEYAAVIVTSENKNVSVEQMIKEFEIIEYEDYLNQVRVFRNEGGNLQ